MSDLKTTMIVIAINMTILNSLLVGYVHTICTTINGLNEVVENAFKDIDVEIYLDDMDADAILESIHNEISNIKD